MLKYLKEAIANLLDAICSETYEPYEYFLIDRGGIKYVMPIPKQ